MKKDCVKIKGLLKNAKTAVVAAHIDPDGDAVGSMLALGMVLEKEGLSVTCYCEDPVPRVYRFLPGADRIKRELLLGQHFDLCFVVDSSDISRVGHKVDFRQAAKVLVNIDHHPDNTNFADLNCVRAVSSAAELIFELAKYFKVKMDQRMAECLYAAIITDTGNFRYENTNVKTFLIAAELLKAGVKTHEITTRIYDTKSIPSVKIAGKILSHIQFSPDHKISWAAVTEQMMAETNAKGEDLIGVVDRIRAVEGVEVAVFFREEKGKVKVNFRSKEKINVSEIARRFGGGGHIKAAGAIIEGKLEEVEAKVITEVDKQLKASKYLV